MKKYLLSALLLAAVNLVQAQLKEGAIVYERKIDVHRRMEDDQMKAMVPQFRTDKHELLFKDNETLYRNVQDEEAPDPFAGGGPGGPGGPQIMIRFGGPGDGGVIYRNYNNAKHTEQTELEEKSYIIDDTIKQLSWKLSEVTKTVLGHSCKKAIMRTERGSDVVAWYAEDIASPAGPETFGGLPGAVLAMDINNGEMIYTAVEIKPGPASKDLKEPVKGTHITRADFRKKMDDLFGPPDANGRIIRKN
ncbi:MAG TPA: GLPGLI family protein [Panacibacter sp.]|nr:GLPGLI family protein [Panacibacter sp.]HNP44742.1 GLPGLI family protein [Panacibacter sp.]